MTFNAAMRVLREKWVLVVSLLILAVAGACAAYYVRPTEFTAESRMYVSAQSADSAQSCISRRAAFAAAGDVVCRTC